MAHVQEEIERILSGLTPRERDQVRRKLARVVTHRAAIQRFPTPGHLRQLMWPDYLHTPMLQQIDEAIMLAEAGHASRWVINCPPQEGKSTELQAGLAWMLLRNPRLRIAFASYEQGIASRSGLEIRRMIETHGSGYRGQAPNPDRVDSLGLMLDPDRAKQTDWRLADVPGRKSVRPGGVISVGVGSALTGSPVDVIAIDDPLKDAKQADSPVVRAAVIEWIRSVVFTRLPPSAIVFLVQTRWHEGDPTGWVLAEDKARALPQWRHLNIPAQAEDENDTLGRAPGEYLISARGRTLEDWERTKDDVGSRWWHAMYQGQPAAPEGGIFKRAWFDKHRVAEAPELSHVIVMVDPADNDGKESKGDEAGIITAGLGRDGDVYVLADDSGHYTVGGWVRKALFALLEHGASGIRYESSLSALRRNIRGEWKLILRQARALRRAVPGKAWPEHPPPDAVGEASNALLEDEDTPDDIAARQAALRDLWPYVPRILALPVTGPSARPVQAKGSKSTRASLISGVYESGRVHHVGHLHVAEHQMCVWLPTQDSPDRMDAVVHAVNVLAAAANADARPGSNSARSGGPVTLPRAGAGRR